MDWSHLVIFVSLLVIFCSIFVTTAELTIKSGPDIKNGFQLMKFKAQNTFMCELVSSDSEKVPKHSIKWKKVDPDGKEINIVPDNLKVKVDKNTLKVYALKREDLTNYTCEFYDDSKKLIAQKTIVTRGIPYAKISVVSNPVDEGDTIKLECDIWGSRVNPVEWKKDGQAIPREESGRFNISDNLQKGLAGVSLTIPNAELTDRGIYSCSGDNEYGNHTAEVMVRVKDKLAALWPFIGICAEVFVLCTIIFIYERKRNKSEMEESDTDQSPEQKNTPDHGKESVRQRK